MSASLDASGSTNNLSSQQVPLDTIPISPAGPNGNADSDMKENQDPNGSSSGANADKDEQITIFHDKDNFNVKHPLIHEWTLWFTKPPSGKVSDSIAPYSSSSKCGWRWERGEECIKK